MKMTYIRNGETLAIDPALHRAAAAAWKSARTRSWPSRTAGRRADREACMECGACARNCPRGAIRVQAGVGCAAAIIGGIIRGTAPQCGPSCGCGGVEEAGARRSAPAAVRERPSPPPPGRAGAGCRRRGADGEELGQVAVAPRGDDDGRPGAHHDVGHLRRHGQGPGLVEDVAGRGQVGDGQDVRLPRDRVALQPLVLHRFRVQGEVVGQRAVHVGVRPAHLRQAVGVRVVGIAAVGSSLASRMATFGRSTPIPRATSMALRMMSREVSRSLSWVRKAVDGRVGQEDQPLHAGSSKMLTMEETSPGADPRVLCSTAFRKIEC